MLSGPLSDIVGSHAEITTLMGPGVDPHLYKPSPGDVRQISSSDLVLFHGHHLEGRMGEVLSRAEGVTRDGRTRRAFAVTERIPEDRLIVTTSGTVDPHLWMDISLWLDVAREIERILAEVDPANSAEFASSITQLEHELTLLDEQVEALLASIPQQRRVLVTAHDAFGYFGRRYGLEVLGSVGAVGHAERTATVLDALPTVPARALTADQVADMIDGVSRRAARDELAHLHEAGQVERSGDGKKGSPFRYWRQ